MHLTALTEGEKAEDCGTGAFFERKDGETLRKNENVSVG
jgi:hypothetical protein